MIRCLWTAYLVAAWLVPGSARAISLVVDRSDTPDVVQAGETVSFSFALEFERDEVLLATQAEISAPHLSDFQARGRLPVRSVMPVAFASYCGEGSSLVCGLCGRSGIPTDVEGGPQPHLSASVYVRRLNVIVPEPSSPLLALLAAGLLALIRRR